MAPTGGFANSTGVDFSPPSPIDYTPGPSPTSSVRGARSKEGASPSKTFNKPPPTAPLSMRQNISPPPLRRADTFRDPGLRRPDRYESYAPIRRRYSDDFRRPERVPVPDAYRPSSPRWRDVSRDDFRTRLSPRDDRYSCFTETAHGRRDSVTKCHIEQPKRAVAEAHSACSARKGSGANPVTGANKEALSKAREAARRVADKINQKVNASSPISAHDKWPDQSRNGHEDEHLSRDDDGKHEEGECVENWATEKAMQNGLALPQPQLRLDIPSHHGACAPSPELPSKLPHLRSSIVPDDVCDGPEPVESIEKENQMEPREGSSFHKPPMKEAPRPSREGSWSIKPASTPSTGTAGSRNKHICRACRKPGSIVTQLVPCKICHKGYHDCCGNPKPRQSERLEDFVCGRCLKKQEAAVAKDETARSSLDNYSPPPIQSNTPAVTSGSTLPGLTKEGKSPRSSLDRYSPTDALVLDNPQLPIQSQIAAPLTISARPDLNIAPIRNSQETEFSHDNVKQLGQTASSETSKHGKMANGDIRSIAKLADQAKVRNNSPVLTIKPPTGPRKASTENLSQVPNPITVSKAASLRDQYKQITCPSLWKGGCWLIEEHCVFAHRDTGSAAPNSNTDAKDFTCPDFAAGRCPWLTRECKYAHYDTGLYVGIDGKASLKHITCWYWKIKGHCIKNEENCLYAHEETGLLSWQPNAESQKKGGGANSLKNFICPRFEDGGLCVYQQRGNCPYTHKWSGKSCLAQYRLERAGTRCFRGFDGHASPSGLPGTLAKPSNPNWAVQAQLPAVLPPQPAEEKVAELQVTQQVAAGPNNDEEAVRRNSEQASHQYSTTQTPSQAMTEQQPPRARGSKAARRGGLGLRPALGRNKTAPTPLKETAQSEDHLPAVQVPLYAAGVDSPDSNTSNLKGAAASSGSIERKKCEGCPKTIYSSGALCQTCAKKQENQHPIDETVAECQMVDTPKPMTPLSIEIPDDVLGSPRLWALTTDPGSVTSGGSCQETAGVNGRKRPANDDHLFVAAKRRRNSQTARDAAIAVLRQERRAVSGGVPVDMSSKGLPSLGDLTNLAIQGSTASERNSTEETSVTTPSVPQDSIDNLFTQVSVGSPSKASPNPPIDSPSEAQTNLPLRLPAQVLGKRARRCSSIDSTAKPSLENEDVELSPNITGAENEASDTARKYARAPGAPVQPKHATVESDESDIDDGDEDDDQEIALGKDTGQKGTTTGARITRSPAMTPAPPGQIVSPAQSSSLQPHAARVHETPTSSPEHITIRSQPMPRCPRCKDTHKRCWHNMDCSPDPVKCDLFVQHYGSQGPSWVKPNDWKQVLEAANRAMLERFTAKNANHESAEQIQHIGNTINGLVDGEDEPEREHSSPLMRPTQARAEEEEEDDEDDVRPLSEIRFSSSSSGRLPRSLESTKPKESPKKKKDKPLANSNLVPQLEKGPRPIFSPLTAIVDSPNAPGTATEGEQTVCSKKDDARALQRLKDQHPGIVFDTESEDEELEDDDFQPPPPTRVDALWQRPDRSRSLFDIDPSYDMTDPANRLAAQGLLPSSTRPSKKQLMGGKLLLYQCAERKKFFGNPHQEVRRYPKEVMVNTIVQRDIDFDNSQEVRTKTEKVTMTFREFLGAPNDPVIEARKDQLVFRNKEAVQQVAGRHGRARRILENEVFPFVYIGNAK